MLSYSIKLVSRMDPIKYLFGKPALIGRLVRWLLLLSDFEIRFITHKSVKERAVSEFLADNRVEGPEDMEFEFPDEEILQAMSDVWWLYFDGASNQNGYGVGVLLVAPDESHIPISFKLNFEVTNNEAEYEACITGIEAALEIGVEKLEIIGDSALVISQSRKEWKVKDKKLKPYHEKLQELIPKFHTVSFMHIPRMQNRFADALATLASMIEIPIGARKRPLEIDQRYVPSYLTIAALEEEDSEMPWFTDVWNYIEKGKYPHDLSEKG